MRSFFVCSAGNPDKDYTPENFERIISRKGFVLHENTNQPGTYKDIKPNDILILKHQRNFVAYGEVTKTEITDEEEFNHWAFVKEWNLHDPNDAASGIPRYGIDDATDGGGKYGTVKTVNSSFALSKISEINDTTDLYQLLMSEQSNKVIEENVLHYISLLESKHQIILQGPPGTGKTRLADMIATHIAQEKRVEAKELDMEAFIKNFKLTDEVKGYRRKREQVLNQFLSKYPLESIDDLELEEYCVGRGDNDSFCWWLETGLRDLGRYFPGSANSYRIYWSKKRETYIKSGYIKNVEQDEKALSVLVKDIQEFLNKKDPELMGNKIGRALILKLLQTYYPDDYFPINGPDHIDNALKLFKIDAGDTTYYERNQLLNKEVKRLIEKHNSQANVYDVMWWMYQNYNLKSGEQEEGGKIVVSGHKKMIQFHPAYTYEDFVRGIVVEIENKETSYEVQNKVLAAYAKEAQENPNAKYVLIIDEINRANLPAVLGELIYALEYRGKAVDSMYVFDNSREIILPKNLYIIGTMNTADRSVGHIDYAIRRRFAFVPVLPKILNEPEIEFRENEFKAVSKLFIEGGIENKTVDLWKGAEYLSKEFEPQDICLGHSYFIGTPQNFKNIRWPYEIKPILEEYIKDGILNTDAKEYIAQLNEQFV
jgi:DNA polymerase III delta prime subunit